MQEPRLNQEKDFWLQLQSSKAALFITRLFTNRNFLKQLALLEDGYLTIGEIRERGIAKIDIELVLYDIIEMTSIERTTLYRLTKKGVKLREAIINLIGVTEEMFNESNISKDSKSTKK